MTEMIWTDVKIGGRASRAVLDELAELIADHFDCEDAILNDLDETLKQKSSYDASGRINFANVEPIMRFCQEHGLTVWSGWDVHGGVCDSGIEYWKPGMEKPVSCACDDARNPTITLPALLERQKAGDTIEAVIATLTLADTSQVPPLECDEAALAA